MSFFKGLFYRKTKNNLCSGGTNYYGQKTKKRFYQKKGFLVSSGVIVILILVFGGFLYKAGYVLNKISDVDNTVIGSLFGVLPGMGKEIEKEDDGKINILLLGMRGQNVPGGGLLTDTIMVVSIKPSENKVALISIPRDLYVKVPGTETRSKINAVYVFGEENGKREGISQMKKIVNEVTGLDIHYGAVINFIGFKQMIDTVGGIDIELDASFYESNQFVKGNECGGQFYLPKGTNHLDGETALCYVRSRENTSDFDRAKRQQVVLQSFKDQLVSIGTLTDFGKLNGILNTIGNNARTDMSSSEMKKFYGEYASMYNSEMYQRVFENSEEGLLMVPSDVAPEVGYVLIPRAGWDNYTQIQYVCREIFSIDPQSDIKPLVQRYAPAPTSSGSSDEKIVSDEEKEEEIDEKEINVKVKGDLSIDSNLEIESEEIEIEEIEIKGPKSILKEIKSVKIDLDDLDKVKKADEIKIRANDLELPEGVKIVEPKNKQKTVLLIVVVEK
ncbi:MAG: LCP family protein [Patescibacteria group bacterium]|nr:LCP family protein [Patescibacteria group bacterium]